MISVDHKTARIGSLFLLCGCVLVLSGCANSGLFSADRGAQTLSSSAGSAVPPFVQNLPKSKTGNMENYTVFGKRYRVMDSAAGFRETGVASWYGQKFHGRKTSSGDIYNMNLMTAAHKHLPLPTYVRVENLDNGKSVVVLVNDRGPFVGNRVIDMSYAAAKALDMVETGTANVSIVGLSTHHEAADDNAVAGSVPAEVEAVTNPVPLPDAVAVADAASEEQHTPIINLSDTQESQNATNESVLLANQVSDSPVTTTETVTIDTVDDGFVEQPGLANGLVSGIAAGQPANGNETQTTLAARELNADAQSSDNAAVMEAVATADLPRNAASSTGNMVIQLGAFSVLNNANVLVGQVIDQTGLPAYVERDSKAALYRVKMGPFQQGELLQNTLAELASVGFDSFAVAPATR